MAFHRKLIAGIAVAFALLISVEAISYRSVLQNENDRQWVTHTHLVIEKLDAVLSNLIDAETGQRAFLLTGDRLFLDPYVAALPFVQKNVQDLQELTADNPIQQRSLQRLKPLVSAKLAYLRDSIDNRGRQPDLRPNVPLDRIEKGRMDDIRSVLADMKSEEQRLLAERAKELTETSARTKSAIVLGHSLALFLLIFAGVVTFKEMAHRRAAEEHIQKLNADLEKRVAERTAQLAKYSEELQRSNIELQQFAYVASHDLQEPLRMVASFTQLLAKRYKEKLDDDARTFIAYAVDGATRMQTLISDLLSYSRVGSQGRAFERISCDQVLDRVLSNLKLLIAESGAAITRQPLPDVLADPQQLGQLFQNLIANAIKFRGEIAPRVDITVSRNREEWEIVVRDNGIGIAPEHAERIFIIFQRLHTRTEYPGTGIGLAVCKKIVERHGGRIWVEGSPGHGSAFYFTIPAVHAHQGQERKHHELPAAVSTD
jgi:signal transduction histidine kinase